MSKVRGNALGRTYAGLLGALMAVGVLASVVAVGGASALNTCNITVNSENVANNAVQTAINSANPGWTVCVGAGTFPEQLTISTSGLTLRGAGPGLTFIAPTSVSSNAVNWDSASPQMALDAIILVQNTSGVTIRNLMVNGTNAASSIGGCAPGYVGIDYQNSSGSILSVAVKNIQLAPSLLGCQTQLGIFAYTGFPSTNWVPSPSLVLSISKATVTGYGKNGITCHDPGLVCNVATSTVTGIGATSAIGQNGIEIAFGAVGHVNQDKVAANNYTGSGSTLDWYGNGYQATGILLYNPGSGTTVFRSTVTQCPVAIAEYATTASSVFILSNSVSSFLGYGIVVNGAPGSTALIANNTVNAISTGAPGILVDNGTFNVSGNVISHASASGTNGASQVVCGAGSYLSCTPSLSIRTAAIQAVSEGSGGPTDVTLFANTFKLDSLSVATLAMPTGSVTTQFV